MNGKKVNYKVSVYVHYQIVRFLREILLMDNLMALVHTLIKILNFKVTLKMESQMVLVK